mgnify:CR=1 FL=1
MAPGVGAHLVMIWSRSRSSTSNTFAQRAATVGAPRARGRRGRRARSRVGRCRASEVWRRAGRVSITADLEGGGNPSVSITADLEGGGNPSA